jgi:hypothetical protein
MTYLNKYYLDKYIKWHISEQILTWKMHEINLEEQQVDNNNSYTNTYTDE